MAEMIARRVASGLELSQDGAMSNALFQPYLHDGDSVERVKVGDEEELELAIDTLDMVKRGFTLPGIAGVAFDTGSGFGAAGANVYCGDVTDTGVTITAKLMAVTVSAIIMDLTTGQSGIESISAAASAPIGTDAGVGDMVTTTPTSIGIIAAGTDAGVSTLGGTDPTAFSEGDYPSDTDAGDGADTVDTTPYDLESVAAQTDAGSGANTGTDPTAVAPPSADFSYIGHGAVATFVSTNAGSRELAYPTNIQSGDLLIAQFTFGGRPNYDRAPDACTSIPSGWALAVQNPHATNSIVIWTFYKVATGSESGNVTWTFTNTDNTDFLMGQGVIHQMRGGFDTADPIDVADGTGETSDHNTVVIPSISLSAANEVVLIFAGTWTYGNSFAAPSGFTEDYDDQTSVGSNYTAAFMAHKKFTASGATGTMTVTPANSAGMYASNCCSLALNPPA